jgi:hypothetical protein
MQSAIASVPSVRLDDLIKKSDCIAIVKRISETSDPNASIVFELIATTLRSKNCPSSTLVVRSLTSEDTRNLPAGPFIVFAVKQGDAFRYAHEQFSVLWIRGGQVSTYMFSELDEHTSIEVLLDIIATHVKVRKASTN